MDLLDDPSGAEEPYLLLRPSLCRQPVVDDGRLVTSIATVGLILLLGRAADSKSGRHDNALATTLSCPGLNSRKSYTPRRRTVTSPSIGRGVGCFRPCGMTHGPYRARTVYLLGDRGET